MVCENYDLCSACEKKGTHTEHPFVKTWIPKYEQIQGEKDGAYFVILKPPVNKLA